jgi:general secretion pathway protein B
LPWWVFALAGLLLVNMTVLAVILMRDNGAAESEDRPAPVAAAPVAVGAPPIVAQQPTLEAEAQPPAEVEYETVSRSELEVANAAASIPEGPTIVRPSEPAPQGAAAAQLPTTSSELRVDMHVYSDSPRDRFVLINMKRYSEGQRLPDGTLIEQITPGGVVVLQNGSRSMLHR